MINLNTVAVFVAALCYSPEPAQDSAPLPSITLPDPLPAIGTPESEKLILQLGGQLLGIIRTGYRKCMANQLQVYATERAIDGAVFRDHIIVIGSDGRRALAGKVIGGCASEKATFINSMIAKTNLYHPFVTLANMEYDFMDNELRDNLSRIGASTKP